MLSFRKPAPVPPRTEDAPAGDDRIQALLAMLGDDAAALGLTGDGGAASGLSDDRLRSLARDLIAQVEERGSKPPPAPAPEPALSVPPPVSRPVNPSADPAPAPVARRSVFSSRAPLGPLEVVEPAPAAPRPLSPPVAMTVPTRAPSAARAAPVHPPAEVLRLIEEGMDQSRPGQEHPGVIALTLIDRPPLEQATALRLLPRGQVRAVHRALRLLEASQMV